MNRFWQPGKSGDRLQVAIQCYNKVPTRSYGKTAITDMVTIGDPNLDPFCQNWSPSHHLHSERPGAKGVFQSYTASQKKGVGSRVEPILFESGENCHLLRSILDRVWHQHKIRMVSESKNIKHPRHVKKHRKKKPWKNRTFGLGFFGPRGPRTRCRLCASSPKAGRRNEKTVFRWRLKDQNKRRLKRDIKLCTSTDYVSWDDFLKNRQNKQDRHCSAIQPVNSIETQIYLLRDCHTSLIDEVWRSLILSSVCCMFLK